MTQIIVPTLGESVSEATVATWLKKEGDTVALDEPLVELETCLLYTSPSPRDRQKSRMPSSA